MNTAAQIREREAVRFVSALCPNCDADESQRVGDYSPVTEEGGLLTLRQVRDIRAGRSRCANCKQKPIYIATEPA